MIYLLKTQNKKVLIPTLTLSLVLALSIFIKIPNNNFEVIAFDVGNADAFLLKTPANKYYMVDTGRSGYNGSKSQAEIIILKYLKDKGIKNIDGIILTHFDADHAGGAEDIIYTLKEYAVVFEFVEQIAHHIHIIGRDNKCTVGNALKLPAVGIGNAGQKVHQSACNITIAGFKI